MTAKTSVNEHSASTDCYASLADRLRDYDNCHDGDVDAAADAIDELLDIVWGFARDSDSYGVLGSDWDVCTLCDAEDKPGVLARGVPHEPDCVLYGHRGSCRTRMADQVDA